MRYIIALAIVAGSVWLAWYLVSLAPEPEQVEIPPRIPFVQTGRIAAGSGSLPVQGTGTVRPGGVVDIAPLVSGSVVWLEPAFQTGGRIERGQPIVRIDESDYRNRLREAEADLEVREARLSEVLEEAQIARNEFEQFSRLQRETGSLPGQLGPLALREPQIRAARAAATLAAVRTDAAKLALSRTQVEAPFAGHIVAESVEVGQYVVAGQSVGRILAADAVEVVVPLSDASAALIPGLWALRAGSAERQVAARVTAEYGDRSYAWRGYVDRAEVTLDDQTRTIDVIVRVPEPFTSGTQVSGTRSPGGLPPLLVGKFVSVEILGRAPEGYFRVPRAALQSGNQVWVVRPDRTAGIVPVRVLHRHDDQALVAGELQDGGLVITGGIEFVIEGMAVQAAARF